MENRVAIFHEAVGGALAVDGPVSVHAAYW
jgi:hypothetical protein